MAGNSEKDTLVVNSRESREMPAYIQQLERLAQEHRQALAKIAQLEADLAEAKAKRFELERLTIPDTMFQLNMDSVALTSGSTIKIQNKYEARLAKLPDGKTVDADKTAAFYEWLQSNGFAGLVQSVFEVWTRDPAIILFLKKACEVNHIAYEYRNKDIHWRTLESWFKEQSEANVPLPTDLFYNWVGRVAVIK